MRRPQSAMQLSSIAAAAPLQQRKATAGARRPVLPGELQDETAFYSERLAELDANYQKLLREYQQKLVTNRRSIRQLHEDNTFLRTIVMGRTVSGDITATELEHLETRKFLDVRRLNRLTHQLEKLQNDAAYAEDVEQMHERELIAPLSEAVTGSSSVALRIQKLEKRLDGLLAEQQSAIVVRDSYAVILEQLHRENASGDQRMLAIEKDIETRHRGYDQLKIMYCNAVNDHRTAHEELRKFSDSFHTVRQKKEKALASQRARIEKILSETKRLEKREVELQNEIEDEQQHIADAELEQQVIQRRRQRTQSAMERLSLAQPVDDMRADMMADSTTAYFAETYGCAPEDEERAAAFDELYRDMMRATGATTLDELVGKYEAEYALRVQMQVQLRTEKQRADVLREDIRREREKQTSRRLNGLSAAPPASRCLREDLHTCVREAGEQREKAFEQGAALQRTLLEVMRRVDLLAHRIGAFRVEIAIPPTQVENLVTNLTLLIQKAISLADETVGDTRGGVGAVEKVLVTLSPSNQRVKLPSVRALAPPAQGAPPGDMSMRSAGAPSALSAGSLEEECGLMPSPDEGTAGVSPCSSESDEEPPAQGEVKELALIQADEPLNREQIKRLAAQLVRREKRRRQKEERGR